MFSLVNVLFMMSNKWFLLKENMFKSPDTTFSDLIVALVQVFYNCLFLQEKVSLQITP